MFSVVNVVMTWPGILAVDRFGRRPLLLIGAAGMAVAQLIVAAVGVAIDADNLAGQRVLISFVCMCVVSSVQSVSTRELTFRSS